MSPFDADTIQPDANDIDNAIAVEDLVGEGRKYKDINELAKAYVHADNHITKSKVLDAEREAELKVLRDLVANRTNPDKNDEPKQTPDPARQEPPEPEQRKNQDVDLSELVRKELSTAESERTAANNINRAAEVMNNHFGSASKAQEAVRRRAEELGVGVEWLRDAASKSPNAFFATMGISATARPQSTPGHSPDVNPGGGGRGKRDMAFYEQLRKSDPKLYNSAETRKQMMSDAHEQGSDFFNS